MSGVKAFLKPKFLQKRAKYYRPPKASAQWDKIEALRKEADDERDDGNSAQAAILDRKAAVLTLIENASLRIDGAFDISNLKVEEAVEFLQLYIEDLKFPGTGIIIDIGKREGQDEDSEIKKGVEEWFKQTELEFHQRRPGLYAVVNKKQPVQARHRNCVIM